jgi:hypothetical protein
VRRSWGRRVDVIYRTFLPIGVLSKDGVLEWFDWISVRTKIPALENYVDLVRILAKGSTYRFLDTDTTNVKSVTKPLPEEILVSLEKFNVPISKLLSTNRNTCSAKALRRAAVNLSHEGWLIRKQDRGPAMILVRVEWERRGVKKFTSSLDDVEVKLVGLKDSQGLKRCARFYLIPKDNKPPPVPGRPIVSFIGYVDKFRARRFGRALHRWCSRQGGIDEIRVQNGVNAVTPHQDDEIVHVGDITAMFTNVPIEKIREFMDNSDFIYTAEIKIGKERLNPEQIYSEMFEMITGMFFQYEGKTHQFNTGLPMGHPISPPLSRAVVTWMERPMMATLIRHSVVARRYVDDVAIRAPSHGDLGEHLKREYAECIKPMTIEWSTPNVYMDAVYNMKYKGELLHRAFVQRKKLANISTELPEIVIRRVLEAEVRRRFARYSVSTQTNPLLVDVFNSRAPKKIYNMWRMLFDHIDESIVGLHMALEDELIKYLSFHALSIQRLFSNGKSRRKSTDERHQIQMLCNRVMSPRKPRGNKVLHVPWFRFWNTRIGKTVLDDARRYETPYETQESYTIEYKILSHKALHRYCVKSPHLWIQQEPQRLAFPVPPPGHKVPDETLGIRSKL